MRENNRDSRWALWIAVVLCLMAPSQVAAQEETEAEEPQEESAALDVVQESGGWASEQVLLRHYARPGASARRALAARVGAASRAVDS